MLHVSAVFVSIDSVRYFQVQALSDTAQVTKLYTNPSGAYASWYTSIGTDFLEVSLPSVVISSIALMAGNASSWPPTMRQRVNFVS